MLNVEEIKKLILEKALVTEYIDLEKQLTPNGFDMSVAKIFEFDSEGALDFSNKERKVPQTKELAPVLAAPGDKHGWWDLKPGAYKVLTNETVNIPKNLIGIAFTRSSLLRMGAFTQNGVWDAGFCGKSEFIIIVQNPYGIRLKQNARLIQIIFQPIEEVVQGYSGIYQGPVVSGKR